MGLIKWDSNLSVGVAEMDKQHQKLIDLINQLNDAMSQGKGKDVLGKTINGLLDYTKTHFTAEEKLMGQQGYTGLDQQKDAHKKFIDKVAAYKLQFETGKVGLTIEMMNFLSNWLKGHIIGEDKKYGPYLAEKGIK
ncbi:MAG: Bacteriohemerythrin [Syntrophus sp. SKADARSKE-3]|nr:Bacteriohemerythrin [Syntrophus sp. SKADARSKE-3]